MGMAQQVQHDHCHTGQSDVQGKSPASGPFGEHLIALVLFRQFLLADGFRIFDDFGIPDDFQHAYGDHGDPHREQEISGDLAEPEGHHHGDPQDQIAYSPHQAQF